MPILAIFNRCRALLTFVLWLALTVYLVFFAAHVAQMLAYPFPLDYGEGPLLAQIEQLRAGTPIWHLYADPAVQPYLVVNYPPVYLFATLALSFLTNSILLAGRLLSLLATLASVWALVVLIRDRRPKTEDRRDKRLTLSPRHLVTLSPHLLVSLSPCLLLSIPVVREWAGYLRVDALALCLGLWGLMVLVSDRGRETEDRGREIEDANPVYSDRHPSSFILHPLVAGLLFVLALYTKPSMVAAPIAGGVWWLLAGRASWQMRVSVLAAWTVMGLVPLVLFQWLSDGWFWLHVFTANTNRWDATLARQFWGNQWSLRWPLFLAAAVSILALRLPRTTSRSSVFGLRSSLVPILYTLVGAITALGVGKVGAYANYFLELYAGLVWLACRGIWFEPQRHRGTETQFKESLCLCVSVVNVFLLIFSLGWYSPMWSRDKLRPAGLLEPNPPQPAFARNGLWRETIRERQVLAALGRVQGALAERVRAASAPIFTDTPGIAAEAGVGTPLQAFEHRQLLDSGHWNQRDVLLGLANGTYPLAVIDFLGNWLTPEMVTLITHRYAQDGSLGTFDMYRPIEPGPAQPLDLDVGDLRLIAYHLASPNNGGTSYSPGELIPLALDWQRPGTAGTQEPQINADKRGFESQAVASIRGTGQVTNTTLNVVVQISTDDGTPLLEISHPLLYGALPPDDWPADTPVQHLQAIALPEELPSGRYQLAVTLRDASRNLVPPQVITRITVGERGGQVFETGYYVPAPLLDAWNQLGSIPRAGLPLTPAVRFGWGTLQCFELLCLEQRGTQITQRPLGDLQYLGETLRNDAAELHEPFLSYWRTHGGEATLGPPISGEISRNGYIVQWTRYARLERPPGSNTVALGRLGDDSLRLSPGMKYRWPPAGE